LSSAALVKINRTVFYLTVTIRIIPVTNGPFPALFMVHVDTKTVVAPYRIRIGMAKIPKSDQSQNTSKKYKSEK
jgi:hypothetical protein